MSCTNSTYLYQKAFENAGVNLEEISWVFADTELSRIVTDNGNVLSYIQRGAPLRRLMELPESIRAEVLTYPMLIKFIQKDVSFDEFIAKFIY